MVASANEKARSMYLTNYAIRIPSVLSNLDRLGKTWTYLFGISITHLENIFMCGL